MIEPDQTLSNVNQPAPFLAVWHIVLGIIRWLFEFFVLTEEDRLTAGVYLGGEGRDNRPVHSTHTFRQVNSHSANPTRWLEKSFDQSKGEISCGLSSQF